MYWSAAAVIAILLLVALVRDEHRRRSGGRPPGPPGIPFLGNLLQLPTDYFWVGLDNLAKRYGPIYTLWLGPQPCLVLNGTGVAADVLDRMSAVTSDRPNTIKNRQFYFHDMMLVLQDRSAAWRAQRRAMHSSLNARDVTRFQVMQENEAAHLMLGLLQHPEKPHHEHLHRYASSVICRSLYGWEPIPLFGPDPSVHIQKLNLDALDASTPQKSLVDMMPFLRPLIANVTWLRKGPDAFFKDMDTEAKQFYNEAAATDHWDAATIAQDVKTNQEKYGLPYEQAVWMTMTLFLAGQETTHTALRYSILALMHCPDCVKATQTQLDSVCGKRPPTFADRDNLPYIDAIVKETLRWRPVLPVGVVHRASEEFKYQDHVIPKDTLIIDNIWGQTREVDMYPDPERFDPERFLDSSGELRTVTTDTRHDLLAFGHGRRVCPGRDFALNTMFIACAYLLWAFKMEWPVDSDGKQIIRAVDEEEAKMIVVNPIPFDVVFVPRQEGLADTLSKAILQ